MTLLIADRGLHLGVLDALLANGSITATDLTELVDSTGPDGPEDGYPGSGPRLWASLDLLHAFPVPAAAVARIDHLDFDGGNEIYMLIEQALDIDTGGESDDYDVMSLEGIQALTGLRSLYLNGHGYQTTLDLTPLANHPGLTELHLYGDCTASVTLESLPALSSLDVTQAGIDDRDVLTRLAARGVTVRQR